MSGYTQEFVLPKGFEEKVDATEIHQFLLAHKGDAAFDFLDVLDQPSLKRLKEFAKPFERFSNILVCGMGASVLCAKALLSGANNLRVTPKFVSVVSPTELASYLTGKDTGILFVSRSGETAETLAQFLALSELYKAAGLKPKEHFRVLLEKTSSPLGKAATAEEVATKQVPPSVCGRFFVFSEVGILPLLMAGADPAPLMEKAIEVANKVFADPQSPPLQAATTLFAMRQKGITNTTIATFDVSLEGFNQWLGQLYGESLSMGKKGMNYTSSVLPADLHTQLQAWMDGNPNTVITILEKAELPATSAFPTASHQRLIATHQHLKKVVVQCLTDEAVPVRTIKAKNLGGLAMHFAIEVWALGKLMGLDPLFTPPGIAKARRLAAKIP